MSAAPFSAVFFEDRFVPASEMNRARVPVTDRGYLLGEGVFATLRGYHGACFRAARHLETLARGAAAFGMTLPMSLDRIAEIADEAAVSTGAADAYVRVTFAQGSGDDEEARPVLCVLARAFDVPSEEDYACGIPVTTVSARRIPPACMDPTVKTTSYAPALLAQREAKRRGVREGIQLAIDGSVACGTMANLFLVAGGVLLTPPLTSGCRAGVTREAVFEIAAQERLDVREERIDPTALTEAEEVFFTSTRVECLPISSVDGRAVGRPHHPRTTALRSALRRLIHEETTARRSKTG